MRRHPLPGCLQLLEAGVLTLFQLHAIHARFRSRPRSVVASDLEVSAVHGVRTKDVGRERGRLALAALGFQAASPCGVVCVMRTRARL